MPAVQVPSFIWDGAPAMTPHLLDRDSDGPLQVVSFYEFAGIPIWFELSVGAQGLVEDAEMRAQAHFMTQRFYDFNAPLTISPPGG
jgi:hypothetical protein